MSQNLLKSLALWSISKGLRPLHPSTDRINELTYLRDLLSQLKIDCVLDVGANRGQFARELRGIGYEGQIVSFEPVASEFLVLQERFKNDRKWSGYQFAAGSREESLSITVPRLTVMSSLLESNVADGNARKEIVRVRRLDSMLSTLVEDFESSRVFLKMDTQGYDLEVFRGISGCLDRIQGIQSELSVEPLYKNMPHYLEALKAYEDAGFCLYNLSVVNRVSNGALLELNCFMRRAG